MVISRRTEEIGPLPALPGSDQEDLDLEQDAQVHRRIHRMDPQGPFLGEPRTREDSRTSNVDMVDVSGDSRIANAPALPKHPVYSGSTTKDRREFVQKYNLYYNTLLP